VEEGTRQVLEIGKDISRLQEILRAPKVRGILGELILEELLSQSFPADAYRLQYEFKSREKCDAVLLLGGKLLPIDAKFPLEDFQRILDTDDREERRRRRKDFFRRVKGHIDDIARKYIRPEEGTFDFAFMYIPAENVYYEMIVKEEGEESLSSYALGKKVIPVSPNSFYAYLQAILLGLRGLEIEKRAEEVLSYIQNLSLELSRFRDDFEILGKHLTNALSKYQEVDKKFSRLEERFSQTRMLGKETKGYLP
jgi:DNA recombination protein RmuC